MTMPYGGDGNAANPSPFIGAGGGGGGGSVSSVSAFDTSVVIPVTTGAVTVRTGTLDVIATDHPPAANWSNNSHKITSLTNGSASSDAAAFGQTLAGGNGAPLTTAGDLLTMDGTPVPIRLAIGTTSQPLTVQSGAPAWGGTIDMGSHKITSLTNGSGAQDAAAFGQILPKAGGTMTGFLAPAVSTITFVGGGTSLVDASLGNAFALTLTASTTTLGNPSNSVDGEVIRIRLIQDATGSRTISYAGNYDFGAAGAPTLSTGANKVDILGFEYVASLTKWCYLGSGLGF